MSVKDQELRWRIDMCLWSSTLYWECSQVGCLGLFFLTLCMLGNILSFVVVCFFFQNQLFWKILSGTISECRTDPDQAWHFVRCDLVRERAKIRNRYNQAPHLTQDTNEKVTTSQLDITNQSQEVSPFSAGDHKASTNRHAWKHNKTRWK